MGGFGIKKTETYVIKKWVANETPNDKGIYVEIEGRKGGLIAFILSIVGIDPVVSLIVDRENVRFKEGSWNGYISNITPIQKICSGNFGYVKPFWGTVVMILLGFFLVPFTFGISLILCIWGFFSYFFNKTIMLGVTNVSGDDYAFAFKRSLIEGKNIDEVAAERIIAIIEMIMLGKDKPRVINVDARTNASGELDAGEQARQKMEALKAQALRAGGQAASKVAASLSTAAETMSNSASVCSKCKATITSEDKFCGNCGATIKH